MFSNTAISIVILLSAVGGGSIIIEAFAPVAARFGSGRSTTATTHSTILRTLTLPSSSRRPGALFVATQENQQQDTASTTNPTLEEVERLKSMAAKLRAEAASLEENQAKEMVQATDRMFDTFDANKDGKVSLEELRAGLEEAFKMELEETRVEDLLDNFDSNNDGALQREEFVNVAKFRSRLEQMDRQEKVAQRDAAKKSQAEQEVEAQLAVLREAINDKAPTNTEKILSVLPYLLPLLDALPYGRFLLESNQDNPLVLGLFALFALYRSVPFSGFLAFAALGFTRENLANNRVIRFNANQAIYLDAALFVPSLLALLVGATGLNIPPAVAELGQDAVFVTLVLAVGYSVVSSLLGATPDKIPFLSDVVSRRTPSFNDLLDEEGKPIVFKDDKEDD